MQEAGRGARRAGDTAAGESRATCAPEMVTEFLAVLEKWVGLTADIASAEELEQLYWNEVYAKLDPAGYGMD